MDNNQSANATSGNATSDNAANTFLAVQDLRPDLPELVGPEQWPVVAAELERLDAAWTAGGDDGAQRRIAAQYRDVLAPWPAAYERVRAPLDSMSVYSTALRQLALCAEASGEPTAAAALRAEAGQPRLILERGVGSKAYSVRLRNLNMRFWKLSALGAAVLGAVAAIPDPSGNAITIAAAVLAAIAGLEALVEEISVNDASVFLGLVAAGGENKQAHLDDIRAATNAARAKAPGYLEPLTEAQVKQAINNLLGLRSIAPVEGQPDVWRVIEEYGRV